MCFDLKTSLTIRFNKENEYNTKHNRMLAVCPFDQFKADCLNRISLEFKSTRIMNEYIVGPSPTFKSPY